MPFPNSFNLHLLGERKRRVKVRKRNSGSEKMENVDKMSKTGHKRSTAKAKSK